MKNQLLSNVHSFLKSTITPAALALMLTGTVPAFAQTIEKSAVTEIPVKVTYVGRVDLQPVFQIDIDNIKGDNLYVSLKDEDGTLLYAYKFKDQKFSKKFLFDTYDVVSMKVTLSLTSKNNKKPQVLQFGNVLTTIEDVVVTKVH